MTTLAALLTQLATAVADMPTAELPDLIGVLATAAARAQARLAAPQSMPTHSPALTAGQIAQMFQIPTSQVYELARQRRLPCLRFGRYVRFNADEVRRVLTEAPGSELGKLRPPKRRSKGKAFSGPATTPLPTPDAVLERPA